MRLDLVLPNEGDYMLEALNSGPHFEAMGWDGFWLSDHLLGLAEDHLHKQSWTEVMVAMAHLAAQTRRARIGSGVLVLPYRDPVLTAKMIASLDHLSGGRIDFGVGVGWLRGEYQALGRGDVFDQRGAFTDETLDAILACWKGGEVEFHGRWFDFGGVVFDPPPFQGARVPLWIGSLKATGAPIRRAAKYADYWHPSELDTSGGHLTPEEFREAGERLDEMAGRRIPRTLRIKCDGEPARVIDRLHRFAEAGCVQAACSFISSSASFADFDRNAGRFYAAAQSLRAA
ncbi:TIGR03619 family F420-dependent LLM class oxidoreductase [Phenylobacterium sp. LjRoot225]|uniref:TIGR03619 family F420-dependent LLM class oxidoreductase n=1 Tax=Phenylobacterium sp. LjRoot225 TaxID=3342285 RepID=UPI003ED0D25F